MKTTETKVSIEDIKECMRVFDSAGLSFPRFVYLKGKYYKFFSEGVMISGTFDGEGNFIEEHLGKDYGD